jgi:hypothetical protein
MAANGEVGPLIGTGDAFLCLRQWCSGGRERTEKGYCGQQQQSQEDQQSGESAAAIHVQSTPAVAPRKNLELDKVPSR